VEITKGPQQTLELGTGIPAIARRRQRVRRDARLEPRERRDREKISGAGLKIAQKLERATRSPSSAPLGTKAAEFHLVCAYRGLATVFYKQGNLHKSADRDPEERPLRTALRERGRPRSRRLAEAGLGADEELVAAEVRMHEHLPARHVIGRVMALGEGAAKLFRRGASGEAERLLERALTDAVRLGFGHEVERVKGLIKALDIKVRGRIA
jgi:hypothetical protein